MEHQAAVYHKWVNAVEELGGETALQALLDHQAEEWTQDAAGHGGDDAVKVL